MKLLLGCKIIIDDSLSEKERNILNDVCSLVKDLKCQLKTKDLEIGKMKEGLQKVNKIVRNEKINYDQEIKQLKIKLKRYDKADKS